MIYEYECIICGQHTDVVKPHYLMDREEYCEPCQVPMKRLISAPYLNYKHNLTVSEKNENTMYRIETGNNRVCVGNEKPNLKPVQKAYPDPEKVLREHYAH